MLKDLMGVHDVKAAVLEGKGVDIGDPENDVGQPPLPGGVGGGSDGLKRLVHADHPARGHRLSEVQGDGSRPTTNIQ